MSRTTSHRSARGVTGALPSGRMGRDTVGSVSGGGDRSGGGGGGYLQVRISRLEGRLTNLAILIYSHEDFRDQVKT